MTSTVSGVASTPTRTAPAAQSKVDAAIGKIDRLRGQISGLMDDLASMQAQINDLLAEIAALEPPDRSEFYESQTRYDGSVLVTEQVFNSAKFNAAMSEYTRKLKDLEGKLRDKQGDLADKERQLATKEQEIARAQQELARAQRELERALAKDQAALVAARERARQAQQRAQKAREEALKAQAEAQKAQNDLQWSRNELDKATRAVRDLGNTEPSREAYQAFLEATAIAHAQASIAVQRAANDLVEEISAADYFEVVTDLASYETGVQARDVGLLEGYDSYLNPTVTTEMREQMIEAWTAAGFSVGEINASLENLGLAPDPQAAAAADYQTIKSYVEGGRPSQEFMELLAAHANDPAYQAALIEQAKNDEDRLELMSSFNLMSPAEGLFGRDMGDGSYSHHFTDEQRAVFTAAMGAAVEAGVYTEAEIVGLATRDDVPLSWRELGTELGIPGVSASPEAIRGAVHEVRDSQEAYHLALEAKNQTQQELEAQMAAISPLLTPEQSQAYVEAYWADHQDVLDNFDAAALDLDQTLARNRTLLETGATAHPQAEGAANALYEGFKTLATSPHAQHAMDFVANVHANPELVAALDNKDLVADVLEPALATVAGQLLANPNTTPDQALDALREILDTYAGEIKIALAGKDAFEKGKSFFDGIKSISDGLQKLAEMRAGTFTPADFAKTISKRENAGAFGKALAVAGTLYAFKAVYDSAAEGDGLEAVGELAGALEGSSKLLAKTLGAYARGGRALAQQASNVAKFLDDFAPFLGAISSGISAAVDIRDAIEDGNAGDWIDVAGELCSFAGAVVACTGPGAPVGAILIGVGTIVSAAGDILSGVLDAQEVRELQEKYLAEAGLDEATIDLILRADQEQTAAFAALGLSPEQVMELVQIYPQLIESHGWGVYLGNLQNIAAAAGLSGQEVYSMLAAAASGKADSRREQLIGVVMFFARSDPGGTVSGRIDYLKQKGTSETRIRAILVERLRERANVFTDQPEVAKAHLRAAGAIAQDRSSTRGTR